MDCYPRRLVGKCALVTGAGTGIGRGIALRLAREGANVAVNYSKSEEQARTAVEEIEQLGVEAIPVRADISKTRDVDNMVSLVLQKFGKLNILVNNAGIWFEKSLMDTTEEMWDMTLDIDLKGVFLCTKRCVPEMMRQGGGKIINISSLDAVVAEPNALAYCAAKAGIVGLTQALALELAPKRININAIAPGLIETPMTAPWLANPKMREGFISRTPIGRVGKPEDIATIVAFLASDESEFINGVLIPVDGGCYAAGLWLGKQIY